MDNLDLHKGSCTNIITTVIWERWFVLTAMEEQIAWFSTNGTSITNQITVNG